MCQRALRSGCRPHGSCARLLPGTPLPRDCSALTPHAGPGPLAEGLSEKESELQTGHLPGRVLPVGPDGLPVTSLLPENSIRVGSPFWWITAAQMLRFSFMFL